MLAPVRSEDDFELKVVGRIPDALAGAYYRNGPNPQFDPQGNYLSIFGVLILNAQDIAGEPATVLKLPRRVPPGFHGNFVAA